MGLIKNLRVGHATNSSSSHSIVIMNPSAPIPESNHDGLEFGWENFVLADLAAKMRYLAVDTRSRYTDIEAFRLDFPHLTRQEINIIWDTDSFGAYIDHDSVGTAAGVGRDVLEIPQVVILGGNDNDEVKFSIPNAHPLPDGNPIVRHDKSAKVLYWPSSGLKVRLSELPYDKASAPELVDVKITDYCPYGCFFCYQGSTKEGKHAPLDEVLRVADALAGMGVFEVALGGGEPMMHPDFPQIIRAFRDRNITPNVTTFGVEWLKRPEVMDVVPLLGGIGVSVSDAAAVSKVETIKDGVNRLRGNVQILPQHAVGTGNITEVVEAVHDQAGWRGGSILLLGFKNVGRGVQGPEFPVTDQQIIDAIEATRDGRGRMIQLSVDTAFLDQHPSVVQHFNVPEYLTSSPEGKFSMYIDLVAGRMGPSSYCDEADYVPYDPNTILDHFAKW